MLVIAWALRLVRFILFMVDKCCWMMLLYHYHADCVVWSSHFILMLVIICAAMLLHWNLMTMPRNPCKSCLNAAMLVVYLLESQLMVMLVNQTLKTMLLLLEPWTCSEIYMDYFLLFVLRCQLNVDTMLLFALLVEWWWCLICTCCCS